MARLPLFDPAEASDKANREAVPGRLHNGCMRLPRFLLAAAVLAAVAGCRQLGPASPGATADDAGAATLARVVDGDTIRVRIEGAEERVRLIGIDTPETHGPNGLRECFGAEASDRMEALLPEGTAVRLVRDVEARDRYGRLLAYVYRTHDGLFINLAMAKEGYATTLTYPPNVAHADEFVAAVRTARQSQRGLWRRCGSADVPLTANSGRR